MPISLHTQSESVSQPFNTSKKFGIKAPGARLKKSARTITFPLLATAFLATSLQSHAAQVIINEIHYDNTGPDVAEGVELLGTPGLDISGWSLAFYNGSDGGVYKQIDIDQAFASSTDIASLINIPVSGLQNGPADGVALIDALGEVVEFLSYEGEITAMSGAAAGLTSSALDVSESSSTAVGLSLQRFGELSYSGSGFIMMNAGWHLATASWGLLNEGQQLSAPPSAVPLPAGLPLYTLATAAIAFARARSQAKHRRANQAAG